MLKFDSRLSVLLRDKMIKGNLAEYRDQPDTLSWVSPGRALEAEGTRARILSALSSRIEIEYKLTKPHLGPLSPGCRICGEGSWSCLFINGKCNCRCFYCPTTQDEISVPTTNRLPFGDSLDYTDYIRHFGFKGVSISGGEPLLTFDRTIRYIEAVRRSARDTVYIWLYTNGTLATPEKLKQLRFAGLDEIRFDISAVDYDLTKVRMASDLIPCVTVEIPAIPEDLEKLSRMLPILQEAGVRHLNLHQLRLTPHNYSKLSTRNYTFLHGESVTVLESELAALSILESACVENPALPINYCSFVYKRRYQQAAARRRNASGILKGHESVTENGFIRGLSLTGDPEAIGRVAEALDPAGGRGSDKHAWSLSGKKDRLFFHEAVWPRIDVSAGRLEVSYSEAVLSPAVSYRCAFKEVRLNTGRKIYIEKRLLRPARPLEESDCAFLEKTLLHPAGEQTDSSPSLSDDIADYEVIRPGLQDYF